MDRSRGASVEDVGQEESKRGLYRKIARPLRRVSENKSTRIESDPLQEAEGEEMTEQEELIQEIRKRLGEMPKEVLPFDLLAFGTTIGERHSMTQNEIIRLVMNEAEALGVNYLIGSSSR